MNTPDHDPVAAPNAANDHRRRAEQYRRQLETVANNATLALFIMDERQQCTYMNPAAEELTGFTLEEVQGGPLHDYVHHTRPDGTPYPLEECPIDQAFPQNMREQGEEVFVHRDGHFYPVAFTASPVLDEGVPVGTIIEVRDITEERRIQAALRESESRFRTMADTAPVLIWTSGTDMLCDWFNQPWLEFTGRTLEQELGSGWAEGVHPEDYEQCVNIYETSFAAREPFSMEYRLRRHDGAYRWVLDNGVPRFAPDGTFLGYIGSCVDIQDQVEHREALAQANRAKSEFLATMSHEIRTPINAIVGYTDLLETGVAGPLTETHSDYLSRIKASSEHLIGLVDDVLDFAKAEAGRMQVDREEFVVGPIVDAALDLVRPRASDRALSLSATCEGKPEARLIGDPNRVRQIVANLLSNAIKFTAEGGRVRVSCGTSARPDGDLVPGEAESWGFIRVEDTGVGMEPEVLGRLFEPFVQAESGYTRRREGTGLGLAISRRLARLMGGDLIAESKPNEGSVFTLWLPAPENQRERPAVAERSGEALREKARAHGVTEIGVRLRSEADRITKAYVRRLRESRIVPHSDDLSDATLLDHATSLVTDLAQSLVMLEEADADDPAALLRDGSAIQRVIADRHGLQRHRLGWTEKALDEEFELFGRELERAVRGMAGELPAAGVENALDLLSSFLQQARHVSMRAFRMAARTP